MTAQVRAGTLTELSAMGHLLVDGDRGEICIVSDGEQLFAIDNNCSHMGSQIHRGNISEGNIICPWHRARFELATGKSLDLYAKDVATYEVTVEGDIVLVNPTPR